MSHGDRESVLAVPSSEDRDFPDSDRFELSVTWSSDAYHMLSRLARSTGQDLGHVVGKAFLL